MSNNRTTFYQPNKRLFAFVILSQPFHFLDPCQRKRSYSCLQQPLGLYLVMPTHGLSLKALPLLLPKCSLHNPLQSLKKFLPSKKLTPSSMPSNPPCPLPPRHGSPDISNWLKCSD